MVGSWWKLPGLYNRMTQPLGAGPSFLSCALHHVTSVCVMLQGGCDPCALPHPPSLPSIKDQKIKSKQKHTETEKPGDWMINPLLNANESAAVTGGQPVENQTHTEPVSVAERRQSHSHCQSSDSDSDSDSCGSPPAKCRPPFSSSHL